MTLRVRLVATLLALAAVGMVALAATTYLTQRDYLEQRVDDQTSAALPAIGKQLDQRGASFSGGHESDSGGDGHDGPDRDAFDLPQGTYGERRDASGARIGNPVVNAYSQTALSPPRLPARLHDGQLLTVDSQGDGDLRYRVRVAADPGGDGITVVAIPLSGVEETLKRLLVVERHDPRPSGGAEFAAELATDLIVTIADELVGEVRVEVHGGAFLVVPPMSEGCGGDLRRAPQGPEVLDEFPAPRESP